MSAARHQPPVERIHLGSIDVPIEDLCLLTNGAGAFVALMRKEHYRKGIRDRATASEVSRTATAVVNMRLTIAGLESALLDVIDTMEATR